MLRKINWFAVMGPMLITAMVLSACGGAGASTQPSDTPAAPQVPAASTQAPAATDQSAATPAATDQSAATPAATDQSMTTPAATDQSAATPAATGSPSASGGALASPGATVQSASNATLGNILTDSQGITLYIFKNDTPGVSNCTGTCAQNWLPLTVTAGQQPVAGTGITGQLGVIQRSDGTSQVTYNDMPLYRFVGDKQPGDTNGQGMLNGAWSVVALTATAPAAPSASTPAAPVAAPTTSSSMDTPAAPAVTPQATSSY